MYLWKKSKLVYHLVYKNVQYQGEEAFKFYLTETTIQLLEQLFQHQI